MTISRFVARRFYEPEIEALRYLPEGPRVLRNAPFAEPTVAWVAIQHGADAREGSINLLDLKTQRNRSFVLPGRPGFFVETIEPGLLLVGMERRLVYFDLVNGRVDETGIVVTNDERVIINDGLAVDGGVVFGTKHLGFCEPVAALYFYDAATRTVRTLLEEQVCSNGKHLCRDAEGLLLVDIDSQPKTISTYRIDARMERVVSRSVVESSGFATGFPDGMRAAPNNTGRMEDESVVVAFYNPELVPDGIVQQIRVRDGAVLCEWVVPGAPRVTCPEFVEMDGEVKLLLTTAVEGMASEGRSVAPGSGAMYLADTGFERMPDSVPLVAV
ncbi:SMP-30/gluconolactonase/LRE family protein [Acidicapsa dinghuensis]|uniref:SMP-30/gluconolactonase/LRE family protein n=1 Tax=Acidicapsa dinghuensis TaxID=2218256 RepID=A0ABW1EIJ8_9BACT|nr:SMP-30/gluconolactonase/LRE family protein [Acidicapsa dinghuensis]